MPGFGEGAELLGFSKPATAAMPVIRKVQGWGEAREIAVNEPSVGKLYVLDVQFYSKEDAADFVKMLCEVCDGVIDPSLPTTIGHGDA